MAREPMKLIAVPLGLTGALDMKVTGEQPDAFLREVRPTFELEHWYLSSQQRVFRQQANVQIVGSNVTMTVPSRERWWIQAASLYLAFAPTDAAGNGIDLTLEVAVAGVPVAVASADSPFAVTFSQNAGFSVSKYFDRPLILSGDNQLIGRNGTRLDQSCILYLSVLYTPFTT